MSLTIDINTVYAVLLADGWHDVATLPNGDTSFHIDSYEYLSGDPNDAGYLVILGAGTEPLIPTHGFEFAEGNGGHIAGPLTAIIAIRHN